VGGDKASNSTDFLAECRNRNVMPHMAQNLEQPAVHVANFLTFSEAIHAGLLIVKLLWRLQLSTL